MQRNNQNGLKISLAVILFAVALVFVYRSFYGMRIPEEQKAKPSAAKSGEPQLAGAKR
jgi:hypothetical protein